ncbi:hypothetical protein P7H60_08795 [Vagococcus carniphilus]|uniref:DUF3144 domain-containing protein n=1 Tax=Vagococcus carniphilus TaxID=218144 RepID=A0AAW8U5W5_9ENTE|nr:hypothetical protein [Vagococcus carniphilus]MDT2831049.1 hypothetical protein [Vagococcus carniphilus]MDT2834898.1 hypothetical protein [Vagococcus carniphilus]MDT2838054.1 hypothetical protein [Vagococcus carniphilus]MDT2849261.1 hypothetical protein [Vagococcus carniphilus]MDT2853785.1 hypothetical protein [Vagococcus carniphilus]
MMEKQTKIDPETFAYHFMNSLSHEHVSTENMEAKAKESLAAYLTAYYIAQRFNNLENTFFEETSHVKGSTYQKILSELNQY